jgi:hypothetical protein
VQTNGLRAADFTDGLSHTFFFGEKHLPRGFSLVYPFDCNLSDAHNYICSTRSAGPGFALAQGPDDTRVVFGGPHVGICQFAFGDGSVRPIRNSINEVTLGLLAQRNDGLPVPDDFSHSTLTPPGCRAEPSAKALLEEVVPEFPGWIVAADQGEEVIEPGVERFELCSLHGE